MIRVENKGGFKKTELYLKNCTNDRNIIPILEKYGKEGVALLKDATPVDTSKTANSWDYQIESKDKGRYEVQFINSNVNDGVNIAIILQYGHGTKNGGYVKGRDYINPALREAFEGMRNELIREVKRI